MPPSSSRASRPQRCCRRAAGRPPQMVMACQRGTSGRWRRLLPSMSSCLSASHTISKGPRLVKHGVHCAVRDELPLARSVAYNGAPLTFCRRLGRAAQQADIQAAEAVLKEMAEAGLPPGTVTALHCCDSCCGSSCHHVQVRDRRPCVLSQGSARTTA